MMMHAQPPIHTHRQTHTLKEADFYIHLKLYAKLNIINAAN